MSSAGSRENRSREDNPQRREKHNSELEQYLLEVYGGKRGLLPSLLRGGLGALAPVYCAGLKTYLLPYNVGLRKRTRLACPVICIGNLTTGGTGKTPMTQTLCRQLQARKQNIVVLSRGYGGANEYGCAVVSDGANVLLTADQAGDEAYLLAQTLTGVPVVVGKDRRVTGALAVERFAPDVIVLDDGMQFWQLHRDLDIVLLNAKAPFDNGWTFPRGLLREPPSHLRRAGIIILTNARLAGAAQLEQARRRVAQLAPQTPLFTADLVPDTLQSLDGSPPRPLEMLQGRPVIALSALGNPASFEAMLSGLGYNVVQTFRFRDHQRLSDANLADVFRASTRAGAAVVTTEKDAVKMMGRTGDAPIYALRVQMQVERQDEFMASVSRLAALALREPASDAGAGDWKP